MDHSRQSWQLKVSLDLIGAFQASIARFEDESDTKSDKQCQKSAYDKRQLLFRTGWNEWYFRGIYQCNIGHLRFAGDTEHLYSLQYTLIESAVCLHISFQDRLAQRSIFQCHRLRLFLLEIASQFIFPLDRCVISGLDAFDDLYGFCL